MVPRYATKIACFAGHAVKYGCFLHCFYEYVSHFVVCIGPSMEPTLYTNNVLLTERISKRFNRLHRGDIIVSKSPNKPKEFICKRIIGLPGDKILIKPRINFNPFQNSKSVVTTNRDEKPNDCMKSVNDAHDHDKSSHINNQKLVMGTFKTKEVYVPRGMVWLEGDNSDNSVDSRIYGPVPLGLIQSRVVCKLFPLSQIKVFV